MKTQKKTNETESFLNAVFQLDAVDRGKVEGFIAALLTAEKYSAKNRITKQDGNIISVKFNA